MMWHFRNVMAALVVILPPLSDSSRDARAEETKLTAKGVEFFEGKIRPVLAQRCYSCHSATAKEVKGGLLLDTREGLRKGGESGSAVVPGDPEESLLIQAIRHETYEMPPGDKLADNVIADFEKWIEMGAPDPRSKSDANKKISLADARKFWSFQPVKRVAPPKVAGDAWSRTNIDRFIYAKLVEKQLSPVHDADRQTLLRRATFDLTGLPPTPEEIAAFTSDTSPDAFANVIDRLLDSPQFGERWGRHWLDAARYGESSGKERNVTYPYAWRYRDYVIDAFNADKPYDRFLREQIAGDLLPTKSVADRNANLVATGLLAIGTKGLNERKPAQFNADVVDEQIDVVTRAVLGVTVACARCHDHKFDPILQTDYYAVAGIFHSTVVDAGVNRGNNKSGYDGKYAYLLPPGTSSTHKLSPEEQKEADSLHAELAELKNRLSFVELVQVNPGLAANAPKLAKGKGTVKERAEKAEKRMRSRMGEITTRLGEIDGKETKSDQPVMAVHDAGQPKNARVNIRGEVDQLGPEVPRGVPTVLAVGRNAKFDTDQSGRLQLASWMASKENPLTARVMANRIWSHLFGSGIVASLDNFGTLGDEPTHPELLDYLANRFVEQGWSTKKLIREIVLSRAYQLSSEHNEKNYAIDGDNQYLWRMSRRRLEAEAIRDSMLAVSGKLDLKRPEASPVMKLGAVDLGRGRNAGRKPAESNHRSVYLPMIRGVIPESLSPFDAADPSLPVAQREVTTVATQALFLMNSSFVIQNCQGVADRVLKDASLSDAARVDQLSLLCLGRLPSSSQRQNSLDYLSKYETLLAGKVASVDERRRTAWASLAQTYFATGEFRYVY